MEIKKIICEKEKRLSKLIDEKLNIGFGQIQKLIRNKNIKINGKRISQDVTVNQNDEIEIFVKEFQPKIYFEDDDIIVVFKPRQIETVSENENDLLSEMIKYKNQKLYAVHRLDRNTEGLVVFAKNEDAKNSLDEAFKNRTIHKFYYSWVVGVPEKKQDELVAYLKKDEKKSMVTVSDKKENGFDEIKTNYRVVKENRETALLEVELLTGKTHQIRAHLAHIGYPIIGDEKYGNTKINKKYNKKFQCLCAYKLIFEFMPENYLSHLNTKVIEISLNDIGFCGNFE